ncbi:DNA-binding NarL/FixJ family response regulator [Cryobacterium mesophilum]|nr:response regulator transcription factor [Terrimesophilobacter mesophilus]MBB5633948.1 DNA-binding NarL/FixJ family response regulator [Terrimesophilobacter mesophilus]
MESQVAMAPKEPGIHRQYRGRTIRVAVVDDFPLLTDGLATHLSDDAYSLDVVLTANSWSDLVSHPEFPTEVTVLDLNLNDSISIGTKVQALRAAGSEVVVISRHADPATVARVLSAGALSYVPKSEDTEELVLAITAAARGESHLPGSLADAVTLIGDTPPTPNLGRQEQRALALYSSGLSIREVAGRMTTTEETVKSYVKRARRKYRDVGIDLGSRASLREHGVREGWVDAD